MHYFPVNVDVLYEVVKLIRPEWTRASINRAARKLSDAVTWDDFATRVLRGALDPHTHSPNLVAKRWDEYASAQPASIETQASRIDPNDPYAADRDPLTGRTDPAKQRERVAAITGRPSLPSDDDHEAWDDQTLYPPPPGYASWQAAFRAWRPGTAAALAISDYCATLPPDGRPVRQRAPQAAPQAADVPMPTPPPDVMARRFGTTVDEETRRAAILARHGRRDLRPMP